MKTSENGKSLIKQFEGLRLESYLCPANVPTIGYGSTTYRENGIVKQVKLGMKITQAQAEKFLQEDLQRFEDAINSLVKVNISESQFDALVSLIYNIGIGSFKTSTLLKKINLGNFKEAADQFDRWVFANKVKLPGLVTRRAAEKKLFLKGV